MRAPINSTYLLSKIEKSVFNPHIILVSIIVVAAIIRVWGIGDIGFNSDESVYSGQAANLAGNYDFSKYFSIFRAHPLFFQFTVSLAFELFGVIDANARLVSVIFSVLTVYVTYLIGSNLYNKKVGLISAFILSILPYHIIVSRQAIVDVPYAFFYSLTLFFIVKYVLYIRNIQYSDKIEGLRGKNLSFTKIKNLRFKNAVGKKIEGLRGKNLSFTKIKNLRFKNAVGNNIWIYAIGVSSGLTFLSKEVGAIVFISVLVILRFRYKFSIKNIFFISIIFMITISPFLILLTIREEASQNAFLYSQWQLSRPPNHPPSFYPYVLESSLGIVLFGLCIVASIYGLISKQERDKTILLLSWILIPLVFFQLWPTKGFYYMLPFIPIFVILGVSFLFTNLIKRIRHNKKIIVLIIILIPLTTNAAISIFFPSGENKYLAGSGGLPYAREAAQWIKKNTPEGSVFMTIGASMGNVIKFYANRDTMAISTNPNPALHNPSYAPIINPDLMLRSGQIHYIVYDMFSAGRSSHFADKLLFYAHKFNGYLIYSEYNTYKDNNGKTITEPAILIYVINNIKGVK